MIAEAFAGQGYMTAGFIANLLYCARQTGLARGFAHYEDYPLDWGAAAMSTGIGRALLNNARVRTVTGYYDSPSRKHGSRMNRDLLRWLDALDGRPFFAFVNYFDAHEPYMPDPRLEAAWATNSATRRVDLFRYFGHEITLTATKRASPEALTREHDAYDASLAGLDADIGALLTALETRGLLKNTVVIITADHGEQFGEHGLYRHGNSLYRELLQVPLIILGPGVPAGFWVDEPVSLRDLAGTMLDLTGHPDSRFPGRSLARTWTAGAKAPPDQPLAELISGKWETDRTVIAGTEQFIHPNDGKDELYDLERDPATTMNLVADSIAAPRAVAYRALLDSVLGPVPMGPR
jgi:arylsulfatase A-like enzyme